MPVNAVGLLPAAPTGTKSASAQLSPAQLAGYSEQAGASQAQALISTAVAEAESGGNTQALGDVSLQDGTWGPSVGAWQIRTVKAQTGTGGTRDLNALYGQPAKQVQSAKDISGGFTNWNPWSTYTSGAYRQYLAQAQQGINALGPNPNFAALLSNGGTAGDAQYLTAPAAQTVAATDPFAALINGSLWIRMAEVVFGSLLLAGAGIILATNLAGATPSRSLQAAGVPARQARRAGQTSSPLAVAGERRTSVAKGKNRAIDWDKIEGHRADAEEDAYYQGAAARAKDTATRAPRTTGGGRSFIGTGVDVADL